MGKQLDQRETVDIKELLMSEVIQTEALVNILEKKGILTKRELLDEIVSVHKTMVDAKRKRK